jgi:hypothetical protein
MDKSNIDNRSKTSEKELKYVNLNLSVSNILSHILSHTLSDTLSPQSHTIPGVGGVGYRRLGHSITHLVIHSATQSTTQSH